MESKKDEPQKVDRRLFAIAFLTAVGLSAGIGGYLYGQKTSRPAGVKLSQVAEPPGAEHTQLDSFLRDVKREGHNEKLEPIVSHLQNNQGKIERRFSFPDYPIGEVKWKIGSTFFSRPARGDNCAVPAGIPIILEIDALVHAAILDNPNLFLRIGPTEFGGLTIRGAHLMDPSLLTEMLKAAVHWSALQTVVLESINGDKAVLSFLNEMPQVNALRLSNIANLDAAWLANQPFIVNQEKLFLANIDAEDTIRRLGATGDGNLRVLAIENASVSSGAIANLQNCPCLNGLVFEDVNVDEEKLKAITQIRSLVTLTIKTNRLSTAQIRILCGDKRLSAIYLPTKSYNDLERVAIKRIDPRIRFEDR